MIGLIVRVALLPLRVFLFGLRMAARTLAFPLKVLRVRRLLRGPRLLRA